MFRKILDQAKNINLSKIKRDSEIHAKRIMFYAKESQKNFMKGLEKNKFYKDLPKSKEIIMNYAKSLRGKFKISYLENAYVKKLDSASEKINLKLGNFFKSAKKSATNSKNIPKNFAGIITNFMKESKEFIVENTNYSIKHVKEYFRKNKKFFDYKKLIYKSFFTKYKRKLFLFGFSAIFVYSVGSNIPNAIVRYKLAQDHQLRIESNLKNSLQKQDIEEILQKNNVMKSVEAKEPLVEPKINSVEIKEGKHIELNETPQNLENLPEAKE